MALRPVFRWNKKLPPRVVFLNRTIPAGSQNCYNRNRMSYAIYKTEAIVLRTIASQEANADVVFLTRDLGKITVRAQAARKLESKMRMQLTRYHHVIIDVVRGAHVWRLTGIAEYEPHETFKDNGMLHVFHRAATLAEHLIRGEDPHPELFDFFVGLMDYIDQESLGPTHSVAKRDESRDEALELFAIIKVLDHLGYWSGESLGELPTNELLQGLLPRKTALVAMINEGIRATQLI